jgi:hypothetical protein
MIWVSGGLTVANINKNWDADALNMGSDEAVYVEDNVFNITAESDGITDVQDGGKLVFRYNTLNLSVLAPVGNHGADSVIRSGLLAEVYNNTFNAIGTILWGAQFRGGTGVMFNNTFSGSWTQPIFFTNYRSCIGHDAGHPYFPRCDGLVHMRCSGDLQYPAPGSDCTSDAQCVAAGKGTSCIALDKNTAGFDGWYCRDQIGRGPSPSPIADQTSVPFYVWNNGKSVTIEGLPNCPPTEKPSPQEHIVEGRDFVSCSDSACAKPGYTPYTYPHPLQRPAPPQNLRLQN